MKANHLEQQDRINAAFIIQHAHELSSYCSQWKNGLIGSQYFLPFKKALQYLPQGNKLRVLDWGCGDGHFSYFLLKKGFGVNAFCFENLGVIHSLLLERFGKKFEFFKAEPSQPILLPYEETTFDAVFSVGVLEHVRESGGDEIGSLKEIHRILKPDGLFLIFHLPNKYSWIEWANKKYIPIKKSEKYTHNFLYRKNDIVNMAKSTGFTILEAGLYNLLPRNMFRYHPDSFSNNKQVIQTFQCSERLLSSLFKNFSQNYYFVLKKQ